MDVRNCKSCGRLFNYLTGAPICPSCQKKLEEKYQKVKEYIYDHPKASISEVAEENEVSVNQIKKWVREERLSFTEDSVAGLQCEGCGKIIKTGRFCKECKSKFANGFEQVMDKPKIIEIKKEQREKDKMRFLK